MKREKFRRNDSARRGNSPRRTIKPTRTVKWKMEKLSETEWVANYGTGISVYADCPEKLQEWIMT